MTRRAIFSIHSEMDERETKVLEAALRVISRYGVKRTTMNDIADEAGVARQTLYTIFASKDEVLRGTIRHVCKTAITAVEADWHESSTLGDKLDSLFEHMVIAPYKLTHSSPEADDIVSGFNAAAKTELTGAYEKYRALVERALAPHTDALTARGLRVKSFADFVERSARGFKRDAKNLQHLRALLGDLKAVVLMAVSDAPDGN